MSFIIFHKELDHCVCQTRTRRAQSYLYLSVMVVRRIREAIPQPSTPHAFRELIIACRASNCERLTKLWHVRSECTDSALTSGCELHFLDFRSLRDREAEQRSRCGAYRHVHSQVLPPQIDVCRSFYSIARPKRNINGLDACRYIVSLRCSCLSVYLKIERVSF